MILNWSTRERSRQRAAVKGGAAVETHRVYLPVGGAWHNGRFLLAAAELMRNQGCDQSRWRVIYAWVPEQKHQP